MKRILRHYRTFLLVWFIWTLVALCFTGVELLASANENRPVSVGTILASNFFRAYVWGAMSPLIYAVAIKYVVDPRRIAWRPVLVNLLFGVTLSLIFPWLTVGLAGLLDRHYFATLPPRGVLITRQLIFTWYTFISLYVPTALVVQAILFMRQYRREEAKNAALQAELSNAQLNALKMQLHPHFLFNSLHAISSLILVEPARANKMVALLGDFLRQTLDHSQEQMVTLEEELAFLRCYLAIEQTRFEDRLSVEFDVDDDILDALVPHMIMQPLVENAVKHGIAPFAAPGRITVLAKQVGSEIQLLVRDSGELSTKNSEAVAAPVNGVGLANVRSRLECLYGDAARLTIKTGSEEGFEVELVILLSRDRHVNDPGEEN